MSAFGDIRAERSKSDGGLEFRILANPVAPRVGYGSAEHKARVGRERAARPPSSRPLGWQSRSPLFDPANAPDGARLVRFADLRDGECQWGFEADGTQQFCGCAIDPAPTDSLRAKYCLHHGRLVGGGFPSPKLFAPPPGAR